MKKLLLIFSMLVSVYTMQAQNLITEDADIGSPIQFGYTGDDYRCMASSGDYLFASFWGVGNIEVWDKSDPANPVLASTFNVTSAPNSFYHFFIDGTTLYGSARYTNKLWIIDISDPTNLSVITSVDIPDFPAASYVEGNYAYVTTDNDRKLKVVDLNTYSIVKSMPLDSEYGAPVIKNGNYLYVGTLHGNLFTFDVSDPTNPSQLSKLNLTSGANDMELIGDYLYIGEGGGHLQTVSVATASAPVVVNSVTTSTGGTIYDLDYDGKYLFAGTDTQGGVGAITVFDLSTPDNPSVLAQSETQNVSLADISVQSGYVFGIAGTSGIFSYTLSQEPPPGNALDFDGTDYVNIGNWNTPTNLTVEAWIYPTNLTGNRTISSQFHGWPTTTSYIFRTDDGIPTFYLSEGGAGNTIVVSSSQTLNTNEWCHIAATYDGTTAKIYINGILDNEVTSSINIYQTTGVSHRIGSSEYHGEYFVGKIEDLRMWNIARTNCDIQQAMNTELVGDETGLVAYYNFNQGVASGNNTSITTLNDKTGTYNGTLTNFTLNGATSNFVASDVDVSGTANFVDNFAPVANTEILTDVTAECEVTSLTVPTATDACAGLVNGTHDATLPITTQGTTVVTWTYDDGNGNTSQQTQNVVIDDVTDPVTPTLADVTGECSATATAPTTTDNCAGTVTGTTSDPLTYTTQGTYTITWNFDDGNGNDIDVTQNVVIDDVTNPTITCVENQVIDLLEGQTVYTVVGTEFDATGDDNCAVASLVNNFNATATLAAAQLPIGTTIIEWTITDEAENSEVCSYNVLVNAFVGISDLSQNGISIYPNPTNGIINFEFANNNIQQITISDITGKQIIEKVNIQQNEMIDLTSFESGIYIIKIQTDNEIFTTKIVKE